MGIFKWTTIFWWFWRMSAAVGAVMKHFSNSKRMDGPGFGSRGWDLSYIIHRQFRLWFSQVSGAQQEVVPLSPDFDTVQFAAFSSGSLRIIDRCNVFEQTVIDLSLHRTGQALTQRQMGSGHLEKESRCDLRKCYFRMRRDWKHDTVDAQYR